MGNTIWIVCLEVLATPDKIMATALANKLEEAGNKVSIQECDSEDLG